MTEPTLAISVVTGLASFLSPYVLPVIPAFLAQLAMIIALGLHLSALLRLSILGPSG